MKAHPLADIFPLMDGAEFDALVADIAEHGMLDRIVLHEGLILDGRNRYRAAQACGLALGPEDFDTFAGGDPLAFVISVNVIRRHLDESQRAMVSGRIANMRQGERTDLQPSANLQKVSIADAAKRLGVSPRSVASARTVLDKGSPDLIAMVDKGDLPVSVAASVARHPWEEQQEVLFGDGEVEGERVPRTSAEIRELRPKAELPPEAQDYQATAPLSGEIVRLLEAAETLPDPVTAAQLFRWPDQYSSKRFGAVAAWFAAFADALSASKRREMQ